MSAMMLEIWSRQSEPMPGRVRGTEFEQVAAAYIRLGFASGGERMRAGRPSSLTSPVRLVTLSLRANASSDGFGARRRCQVRREELLNEPSHAHGRLRAHGWQPVQNERFSWQWLTR